MKVMHSEWTDRLHHWIRTLKDDFYEPLGEIAWEAFRTKEHRTPEEVAQIDRVLDIVGQELMPEVALR